MYTELVLKCRLNTKKLTAKDKSVLNFMFKKDFNEDQPTDLPDHPLFKTPRWFLIGNCSSYYHIPESSGCIKTEGYGYIFSRSDFKNYDQEIELFLDWIYPFIDEESSWPFMGWYWYEESEVPFAIIYTDEKIVLKKLDIIKD